MYFAELQKNRFTVFWSEGVYSPKRVFGVRPEALAYMHMRHYKTQFSSARFGTRLNSRKLLVTRIKPWLMAWAAI